MQYSQGGPIIAVQVENEYGSYAKDDKYMPFIKEVRNTVKINQICFKCSNFVEEMNPLFCLAVSLILPLFRHYCPEASQSCCWPLTTRTVWSSEEWKEVLSDGLTDQRSLSQSYTHRRTRCWCVGCFLAQWQEVWSKGSTVSCSSSSEPICRQRLLGCTRKLLFLHPTGRKAQLKETQALNAVVFLSHTYSYPCINDCYKGFLCSSPCVFTHCHHSRRFCEKGLDQFIPLVSWCHQYTLLSFQRKPASILNI